MIFQDWVDLKIMAHVYMDLMDETILNIDMFQFPFLLPASGVLEQWAALEIGSGPKPYPSPSHHGGFGRSARSPWLQKRQIGRLPGRTAAAFGQEFGGLWRSLNCYMEGYFGGLEGIGSWMEGLKGYEVYPWDQLGQLRRILAKERQSLSADGSATSIPTLQTNIFEVFHQNSLLTRCHNFSCMIDTVQKKCVNRPTFYKIH